MRMPDCRDKEVKVPHIYALFVIGFGEWGKSDTVV